MGVIAELQAAGLKQHEGDAQSPSNMYRPHQQRALRPGIRPQAEGAGKRGNERRQEGGESWRTLGVQ
jgi:hypothetical protein